MKRKHQACEHTGVLKPCRPTGLMAGRVRELRLRVSGKRRNLPPH